MNRIEKLLKEKYSNELKKIKLENVIKSYSSGLNPRKNFKLNDTDANLYYVTVKEITTGEIIFSDKTDRINKSAWDKIQYRSRLEFNDILLSGIGTIGKVALVDIPTDNWNCSESVILLKPKSDIIIPQYLVHLLRSDYVQKQWQSHSVGSTLKGLRKENVLKTEIYLPPLEIQKEIVKILDKFVEIESELRAELKAREIQYEFWKDKLFHITGTSKKISEAFQRIKGTSITAGKMKEIAEENGEIRIFAGGKTMVDTSKKNIPLKDIVNVPSVIVQSRGIINFIYYEKPFSFKNEMWAYTCDNKITVKYLYYFLKNNVDYFRKIGNQMGSMPQISLSITEEFEIIIPSLEEQHRIVNILDKFENLINDIHEEMKMRKMQYEYYRNKLLNFDEVISHE